MDEPDEDFTHRDGDDAGPARVGSTVRRRMKPWSASIHALLQHLEQVGFDGAPRVLGVDSSGREILTYVPGDDGRTARCYDDEALAAVARLIRNFHDAVADFRPPPGAGWYDQPGAPAGTLICHNDLGPANTIFRDGRPQAIIDWDRAVPSTAVWDLSYAVRTFVPLYDPQDCIHLGYQPGRRRHRLGLFCEAYGLDRQLRRDLLPMVRRRLGTEHTDFARRCEATLITNWDLWSRP